MDAMKQYSVIFERGEDRQENWGAVVPALPGCVSTGDTLDEAKRNIKEAIELYLEVLRDEGFPNPEPYLVIDAVEVDEPAPIRREVAA